MTIIGTLSQPPAIAGQVGGLPMPSVHSGTAQAAFINSLTLAASAVATDDAYKGFRVRIVSGTGAGQDRRILGSRKNWIPNSEQFDTGSGWSNSGVTLTPDAATSPRGDVTADLLVATAASNRHTRYRTVAFDTLDQEVSIAVFGKHASGAVYLTTYIADGGFQQPNRCGSSFDLQTGAIGVGTHVAGTATFSANFCDAAGSGWWMAGATGNLKQAGSGSIAFCCAVNSTFAGGTLGNGWLGDGTSGFALWGAMGVLGAKPSFYVPTVGAAAVGIQVDSPWLVIPDATSTYEIYIPGATASGTLNQPPAPVGTVG